jgi:spore germination cell wall hydrolase CwlJ-like protein
VLTVVAAAALYGAGVAAIAPSFDEAPAPVRSDVLIATLPVLDLPEMLPEIAPSPKPTHLTAARHAVDVSPRDLTCLAQAVYYEARGETRDGQRAVAEVVLRRVVDGRWPRTICGVVYQDAGRTGCQFSFACGHQHGPVDWASWRRALDVANYELTGPGRHEDMTLGATHFHTTAVSPSWSRRFPLTARIGTHIFYRQPGGSYDNARAGGATS